MKNSKLRILGFDYEIVYQKDLGREHSHSGLCDPKNQRIKIDADLLPQSKFECLIHEVLEALDVELVLKLEHDAQLCKVSTGLFQVLSDNKEEFIKLLKSI